MNKFDEQFARYGVPQLMDQFGETIGYTPKGASPISPAPTAIVHRRPPKGLAEAQRGLAMWRSIQIPMSILANVTLDGDVATIPYDAGDTQTRDLLVKKIISQSGGMWHLKLG